MQSDDLTDLKRQRYGAITPGPPEPRLETALGLVLRPSTELGDAIMADLDPVSFGIGWWADQLPTIERILISDHLVACARAVASNLIEAYLALLEFELASKEFAAHVDRGVTAKRDYHHPAPRGPYDDLLSYRIDASIAELTRALGSALDCVAGCMVGVAALPLDLVRADLSTVRAYLINLKSDAVPHLLALGEVVLSAQQTAGPEGWLDWLTDMRNTSVHRGRRLGSVNIELQPAPHNIKPSASVAQTLPRSPGLTEIEAWQEAGSYFGSLLLEPAGTTLRGAIESTNKLIVQVCTHLTELWQVRRSTPTRVVQPLEQWSSQAKRIRTTKFAGYAPNPQLHQGIASLGATDEVEHRLRSAALTANNQDQVWMTALRRHGPTGGHRST